MTNEAHQDKCPHCGSTQLDTVSINMDAVKCRKCGRYVSGLELLENKPDSFFILSKAAEEYARFLQEEFIDFMRLRGHQIVEQGDEIQLEDI